MKKALFLDVETTGLGSRDKVIQIAYILTDLDLNVIESGNEYLYTSYPISEEALRVHKINKMKLEILSKKKKFKDKYNKLKHLFEDKDITLIAHNAHLDLRQINQELQRLGKPKVPWKVKDTMPFFASKCPEGLKSKPDKVKLEVVWKYFYNLRRIDEKELEKEIKEVFPEYRGGGAHSADYDTYIMYKMIKEF